jgi:signal transduction histidine kinase
MTAVSIFTRGVCLLMVAAAWLLAPLADSAALAAGSKRVMVLHSFGRDFKPWNEYARTIRTELERQSPWPLDIVDHSLVGARSSVDNSEQAFVDYLHALYPGNSLDLIVSIGAPAAAFVQRHRPGLFANVPMLFTAVDERRVQFTAIGPNDTVAAVRIDYLDAIENILRVLPDTKNVMMVVGTSPIEQFWHEEISRNVQSLAGRVTFSWTDTLSFDEILRQAAALPPRTAIFWELMIVDAAGVVHEGNAALAKLHAVANAPIFSYDESFFGGELVGGPMLSVLEGSRQAAATAVRILGGEKAGDIKVPPVRFATPKFDWREMQRWKISEASLPPGSQVHFRQLTTWERYRVEILAVSGALLVQTILISWLIYEHQRRTRAEIRSRRAIGELANMNRIAAAGELSASIAHEITQPITGMVLKANAALRWLAGDKADVEKARGAVAEIVGAGHRAADIITGVRAMFKKDTNERIPVNLNNLINTVLALLRTDLQSSDVRVETKLNETLPDVTGDPVQLQQVILNLVVNAADAMRAVQPRVLQIQTTRNLSGMVRVSIEDSGTGISEADRARIFDPMFTTKAAGMGMGLAICQSIIESHGGKIWVSPAAGRGAVFQFELEQSPRPGHDAARKEGCSSSLAVPEQA